MNYPGMISYVSDIWRIWRRERTAQRSNEPKQIYTERFLQASTRFCDQLTAYEDLRNSLMPEINRYMSTGQFNEVRESLTRLKEILEEVRCYCNALIQIAREDRTDSKTIAGVCNFAHLYERDNSHYYDIELIATLESNK